MKSKTIRARRNFKAKPAKSYTDIAPKASAMPRRPASGTSLGAMPLGFDQNGYPVLRNLSLPTPFRLIQGRRYSATEPAIQAMSISSAPGTANPVHGSVKLSEYRLKPSPASPAAPSSLPQTLEFCVQKGKSGDFLRFRDQYHPLHGSDANIVDCFVDSETNQTVCGVILPGQTAVIQVPLCEEESGDKESLSPTCCVKLLDDKSGQLVCAGSSYDLLIVQVVADGEVNGVHIVSVEHPDLPGGGARLAVCEAIDEDPDVRPCCIEEDTGLIVCPEGADSPWSGMTIPLKYLIFNDGPDGARLAVIRCEALDGVTQEEISEDPDLSHIRDICNSLGGYVFYACSRGPAKPLPNSPVRIPDVCCYDEETGTIVCEGTPYHGLEVKVVAESIVGERRVFSVEHPSLPGGGLRISSCDQINDSPPPRNRYANWKINGAAEISIDNKGGLFFCTGNAVPGRRSGNMRKSPYLPGLRGGR
jgi:hypothetical protein